MSQAFYSSNPDLRFAVNALNNKTGLMDILLDALNALVNGISNGAGSTATSDMVEKAVQWAEEIIYSYSYPYLKGAPDALNREGNYSAFDCGGFVDAAFYYAGFNVERWWTGTMRAGYTGIGFTWYPWSQINDASKLLRGDILLNETGAGTSGNGHTGIWNGNAVLEFTGGNPGGGAHDYLYWWGGTWDGVLRYVVQTTTIDIPSNYGGGIKSYEPYETNWNAGTLQRELYNKWVAAGKQYINNIAVYESRYLIACTTKFGEVGEKVNWTLENGEIIKTIVGDHKDENDPGANEWGHEGGNIVLEFCVAPGYSTVSGSVTSTMPQWNSRVVKAEKLNESVL